MPLLNAFWWFAFTICGLFIQGLVPGIDALAPGIIISLQEKRWQQTFWLSLVFVLTQEGAGSLGFGAAPLWYAGITLLYLLGCRFFMGTNALFVILLSLALGLLHFMIILLISKIGSYPYNLEIALTGSLMQTLAFPLLWAVFSFIRKRCFNNALRT